MVRVSQFSQNSTEFADEVHLDSPTYRNSSYDVISPPIQNAPVRKKKIVNEGKKSEFYSPGIKMDSSVTNRKQDFILKDELEVSNLLCFIISFS
jgi:hypothetical protein